MNRMKWIAMSGLGAAALTGLVGPTAAWAELIAQDDFVYRPELWVRNHNQDFGYDGGQNGPMGGWTNYNLGGVTGQSSGWGSFGPGGIVGTAMYPDFSEARFPRHMWDTVWTRRHGQDSSVFRNWAFSGTEEQGSVLYFSFVGGFIGNENPADPLPGNPDDAQLIQPRGRMDISTRDPGFIRDDNNNNLAIGFWGERDNSGDVDIRSTGIGIWVNGGADDNGEDSEGGPNSDTPDIFLSSDPDLDGIIDNPAMDFKDMQMHRIVGRVEFNYDGSQADRITAWADPDPLLGPGGNPSIELIDEIIVRDFVTDGATLDDGHHASSALDLSGSLAIFAGRTNPQTNTNFNSVALGTEWEDMFLEAEVGSVISATVERLKVVVDNTGGGNSTTLVNDSDNTLTIDSNFIQIKSKAGSLEPGGWNSRADDGEAGWFETPASENVLVESSFAGSIELAPGESIDLGSIFDLGGAPDLVAHANQGGLQNWLPVHYLTDVLGDMDGNGVVDAFDVAAFELALADKARYILDHPGLDPDVVGDIDDSGVLDAFDVAGFEALLAGGAAVPEPASLLLLVGGGLSLARRRRL